MAQLAVLCVLRNEASRWLPSALKAWSQFSDCIVALDDGSTDATPQILQANPKVHYFRRQDSQPLWGAESGVRQELWRLGVASGAEWLFVLDSDMVPACDPRPLLAPQADAVAFRLYDLWNLHPLLFRTDGFWQAHHGYRIWCVKNPGPAFEDFWPDRGIHCGHLPRNLDINRVIYAPPEYSLLHAAYSDPESRRLKAEQYASRAWQLTQAEQEHAGSIMDGAVKLAEIPFPTEYEIRKA